MHKITPSTELPQIKSEIKKVDENVNELENSMHQALEASKSNLCRQLCELETFLGTESSRYPKRYKSIPPLQSISVERSISGKFISTMDFPSLIDLSRKSSKEAVEDILRDSPSKSIIKINDDLPKKVDFGLNALDSYMNRQRSNDSFLVNLSDFSDPNVSGEKDTKIIFKEVGLNEGVTRQESGSIAGFMRSIDWTE